MALPRGCHSVLSAERMRHGGEAFLRSTPGSQACERSVTSSEHPRREALMSLYV